MSKTLIRTVTHKTGERITLLFWRDPYQPIFLPFLWVTLNRRYKARETIDKDIRSLQAFYEYCGQIEFDLELAVLELHFDSILASYEKFGYWIKNKRKTDKVVARIENVTSQNPDDYLGASTVNAYLGSIKTFVIWCIDRYMSTRSEKTEWVEDINQSKDALRKV
jgi:hypothetical protein